jgi:hypothetical protein
MSVTTPVEETEQMEGVVPVYVTGWPEVEVAPMETEPLP